MKKLPKFFVAVDDSTENGAAEKVSKIVDVYGDFGIKINMDLVFGDINVVNRMKKRINKPLFVDLKMWNGERTMAEVIKQLADFGVDMTNVYAHAANMLKSAIEVANKNDLIVLGVTVLTHYTEKYCDRVYGKSMVKVVRILADIAIESGCHGIILPGTTLDAVSDLDCIKFNPATRPDWFKDKKANVQEQIMAPGEAIKKVIVGTPIVSCGSPIFKSPDPAEALKRILDEVNVA
jgi:orotidine-5'-phosphate decarboxylase